MKLTTSFVRCAIVLAVVSLGQAWSADAVNLKVGDASPVFQAKDDSVVAFRILNNRQIQMPNEVVRLIAVQGS